MIRNCAAVLFVILTVLAQPSVAQGPLLPGLDAQSESVLLDPERTPDCVASRGQWVADEGVLEPLKGQSPMGWFWLARLPAGAFDNGTIRARFEFTGRPEATLLFRARASRTSGRMDSGYGLRICGQFAWLIQFRKGKIYLLGHKVFIKPGERKVIELLVVAMGPHLVADLYDPEGGQHLATISTHEALGREGTIGVMAGCNRKKRAAHLTRLSVRPSCQSIPGTTRAGPPLAVWMPTGQNVDQNVGALELERVGEERDVTVWRMDSFGLERLFCKGSTLLQVTSDLPWKYLDPDTLSLRGQPPMPTERGFRRDLSYKDSDMVEQLLRAWHERYPQDTKLELLGRSWQGRPIWALAVGKDLAQAAHRPAILLNGSHHGDELLASEFVLDAIGALLEESPDVPELERLFKGVVFWCVPLVNPDGLSAFMDMSVRAGRKNGRDLDGDGSRSVDEGVDLNRNYPFRWGRQKGSRDPKSRHYHGPSAGSEPETKAMMTLADREHFVASLSYHIGNVVLLAPYTIDGVKNPEPNEAWLVAEQVAKQLPSHPSGRPIRVRRNIYSVSGVDQDWHRFKHGTVALLLEGANWPPPTELEERARVVAAIRPSWMVLAQRFLDGPSLVGRVVDAFGKPVSVVVDIREVALGEGERWTTRARDGRFFRFLPGPGKYHVIIRPPGRSPVTREIELAQGQLLTLDVKL